MSKILVVDDEAIITMQLEERLSAMGYTVAGMASSGEDAIEKARRLTPDLVLMDIVMPGKLNGIEAAKTIAEEWISRWSLSRPMQMIPLSRKQNRSGPMGIL